MIFIRHAVTIFSQYKPVRPLRQIRNIGYDKSLSLHSNRIILRHS
ncbi:hypothetical protein ECRM12761_12380 [Escherichia coli O145:H28 str. RM12761]|uniref:Uncharacterized protein n=1 Tax=Escherichia coli O145:H28 (strain RM12581) TaxID=1248823 RepID=A0ABC7ZTH6_ECOLR|nr:hypothetical protein ECRM13514_2596 [Escherichia coli O145:H28 str. RM13514]AHG15180.1 hypothetical protein ECRM13516_2522 [Escherichia coli O145:H28 str. RM13516]AHY65513.1 hypothetical protein ECRM12761_12380 [Escherichia coli O145:H28 str. RM12761]AHY71091.1 hypothetical protein ECRM12581_12805 [Escherichia coli O145:H28 str. RM12581]